MLIKRLLLSFVVLSFSLVVQTVQSYAQACVDVILAVGDTGTVVGDPNRLRSEPSGSILLEMPSGNPFTVLEIGECIDGIQWVKVRYEDAEGWTAESADGEAFVRVVSTAPQIDGFVKVEPFRSLSLNADGSILALDNRLYNANDLTQPPRILENRSPEASSLFSPIDPNLLFRYLKDYQFALIDVRDNSTIWSLGLDESTGIANGFSQDAQFTPDGSRVVFSSTDLEYAWTVLDIENLTIDSFDRSYYGETVAIAPDNETFTRFITLIFGYSPETPPTLFHDTLTPATDIVPINRVSNISPRYAGFRSMLYLPDSRLLTADAIGMIDVWGADLTYLETLPKPVESLSTRLLSWDVRQTIAVLQTVAESEDEEFDLVLRLLDVNSLQEIGRLTIIVESPLSGENSVFFHPDGRLGLMLFDHFRWLNIDDIINGSFNTLNIPS